MSGGITITIELSPEQLEQIADRVALLLAERQQQQNGRVLEQ